MATNDSHQSRCIAAATKSGMTTEMTWDAMSSNLGEDGLCSGSDLSLWHGIEFVF